MKKLFLILIILESFVVIGCGFNKQIDVELPDCYYLAKEEYENENYRNVIQILKTSDIKQFQKTDWYYYYYAMSLYKLDRGNARLAIEKMKIAVTFRNEQYPEYHFILGQMYYEIADYKNAEKCFEKAETLQKKLNTSDLTNVSYWRMLCESKIHKIENQRIKKFLGTEHITEEMLNNIIVSEKFNIDEKILISDCLLQFYSNREAFCSKARSYEIEKDLYDFFSLKYIYYNLNNTELCKQIFTEISTVVDNEIFFYKGTNYNNAQLFSKYQCFYYLKKGFNEAAIKCLNSYQSYKYKPVSKKINNKTDFNRIKKEFCNDEEYLSLF